jgi:membrane protease YdiL (CAAX protease family)
MDARSTRNALTFYAIALALAVVVRLAVPVVGRASLALTMLTPAIAAAIMLAAISPEGSLREAARNLGLTTAGLKGWPLAIAGPALIQAAGLAILVAAGLTALAAPEIRGSVPAIALNIMAGFVIGTAFALAEEVGWRGYMLPRLLGWGVVPAMLITGFLHGAWHLPLMLTTGYYHPSGNPWIVVPLFLLTLTLAGVFFGFLRIWTGSVWPVAVAHAAANTAWGVTAELSQTQSPIVLEYVGGESGAVVIGGLLIFDLVLIAMLRRARPAAHG